MRPGSSGPPLFFLHIMKTGGTTLRQIIRKRFEDHQLYPSRHYDPDLHHAHTSIEYLVGTSEERRAHIRAFMGHFPFVAAELLRQELFTLTILRDPVERTISHLKHLQIYSPEHLGWEFEQLYEDEVLRACFLQNHQTKMFALTEADRPTMYLDVVDIDAERLVIAKDNLDKIDLVGFVECYVDFLEILESRFGWRLGRAMRRRVGPDGDVSKDLRRRIEADNAADLAFYEHARHTRKPKR